MPSITGSGRLRALMVTPRFFPSIGGVETHVYEVGRRMANRGVEITVLTTDPTGDLPVEETIEGMTVRRAPAWPANRDYYFAPGLWREIQGRPWDIVHCQGAHTLVAPLGMFAAKRARLPYVVTFHTGGDTTPVRRAARGAQWQALRPLFAGAARLVGPSMWEVEYFRKALRLPRERFAVIPNGAQRLPPVAPAPLLSRHDPLIVSVGRLTRYKGHHRVIAAMPHVLKAIPGARLRIVGIGPEESALRRQAESLGVAGHVTVAGLAPGDEAGMADILARADLVTLLSEHEAQGIAVMEALALGRPALVADTTALHELAARGLARAVAVNSAPEQVAAAMLAQLRAPLIPYGASLPTWDQCVTDLITLYEDVGGRQAPSAGGDISSVPSAFSQSGTTR